LRRMVEATTVSPADMNMTPGRRAERREQLPQMEPRPVEGRSLRGAGGEAKLGPTLSGVDNATLVRTLLPRKPIDPIAAGDSPGPVVAGALLDPAYQLK